MPLFRLVFRSLAPGISPLAFDEISLHDVWGPLGVKRTYAKRTGSITVLSAPVHEPATLALLASAGLISSWVRAGTHFAGDDNVPARMRVIGRHCP